MKNKSLILLPCIMLASCSIIQPEPEDKPSVEEVEKNDEVIIGLMSGPTQPTYHYDESPTDFYNNVICDVHPDFFAFISMDEGFWVATQGGFDNFDFDQSGSISKENENGTLLIEVDLNYPVFGNNLEEKYDFNVLIWNIQKEEISCVKPSFIIGEFEKGMTSYFIMTKDVVYASVDSEGHIEKYYKYSRLAINYIPVHDKVESYVIKEYNKNDELIKTYQGDFEDIEYCTDVSCENIIIEKTCKHYSYDWDELKLISTDVVIKEAYNRVDEDNNECVCFYEEEGGEIQKQKLSIYFDDLDY